MDEEAFARAEAYARRLLEGDSGGHDIHHAMRVHAMARRLCAMEGGDEDVVRMAAILHDVDDPKLFRTEDYANARAFLESEGVPEDVIDRVVSAISTVSFRGGNGPEPETLEAEIVQDADRMDAIGAIGVARAFAYGGSRGRPMHDPDEPPRTEMTEEEYRSSDGTTINHFHEKLLKLAGTMRTESARAMAARRHEYLEGFLEEFLAEWDGLRRGRLRFHYKMLRKQRIQTP